MPDHDYGPDPHLNERGVRLSRRQRRTLAAVAVVIGLVLGLAVVGIAYGLPPQWAAPAGAARWEAVASGSGRAVVTVLQDGIRVQRGEVDLPHTTPVDGGVVVMQVRRSGTSAARDLGCAVRGEPVRSFAERRDAEGVQCEAVLPDG